MPDEDVATTLSELERKLKDLEDELHSVPRGGPDDEGLPPGAAPPAPALIPSGAARPLVAPVAPSDTSTAASGSTETGSQPGHLAELVRFREQLERSAREFLAEYERVLASLRTTTDAALAATSQLGAAPLGPPAPGVVSAAPPNPPAAPETVAAPWARAPSAVYPGLDTTVLDGVIAVDAGPFSDIATLSAFEQALGSVPGVRDVQVRAFEGSRALIDVSLSEPVALGAELRRTAPVAFAITQADAGRLTVAIEPRAG